MALLLKAAAAASLALALSAGAARRQLARLQRTPNAAASGRWELSKDATGGWLREVSSSPAAFTFENCVPGGRRGGVPPPHRHTHQKETFEVLNGTMGHVIAGVHGTAVAGETVTVPVGVQHYFYSAAEGGALLLRSTHAPGLSSRRFFSNLAGLVRDYGAPAKVPRLQRLALYYGHNMELLSSHAGNAAVRAIALPLARLHGFRAAYAAYEPAEA